MLTAETNLGNLMADALLWQANELAANFGVEPADVALMAVVSGLSPPQTIPKAAKVALSLAQV